MAVYEQSQVLAHQFQRTLLIVRLNADTTLCPRDGLEIPCQTPLFGRLQVNHPALADHAPKVKSDLAQQLAQYKLRRQPVSQ